MEDGTIKKGYVDIPTLDIVRKLKFKETEDGSITKLKINKINKVTVYSDDGQSNTFESVYIDLTFSPKKERISGYKVLMLVREKGYATLYIKGDKYKIRKDGSVDIVAYALESEGGVPVFRYYIRKKGKDYAAYFAYHTKNPGSIVIGIHGELKQGTRNYLSEYPKLVKEVENREYTHKNIPEIIEVYNEYMNNKKEGTASLPGKK
jgi:hypothetical protein